MIWGGSAGLARREDVAEKLKALEQSALDFYLVLRSAYIQDRESLIRERRRELWWTKGEEQVEAEAPEVAEPSESVADELGTPDP